MQSAGPCAGDDSGFGLNAGGRRTHHGESDRGAGATGSCHTKSEFRITLSGSSHTNRCRLEVSVTPRVGVDDSSHTKYSCIYRCMLSIGGTVSQ